MGYKCDIVPLDLRDGRVTTLEHMAGVKHQPAYLSRRDRPGLPEARIGAVRFGCVDDK